MERWIQRVVTEQKTDPRVFLPNTPTPLIFNIYFFSLLSTVWTDVKSWSNYLQGNYSTAAALQPQYRGLFSRSPSNQHTDCLSDWDQKKLVFDTSLLILALPNWPSPPTASHLRPYQPRCTPDGISKQQKQSCVSANPPPAATTPLNEMHTAGVHIRQCFHVLFVYQIFLLSVLEDGCSILSAEWSPVFFSSSLVVTPSFLELWWCEEALELWRGHHMAHRAHVNEED